MKKYHLATLEPWPIKGSSILPFVVGLTKLIAIN
jgi:hypothetical protein